MCALKSRGMSVVCTWELRGIFFLTLELFVLFSLGAVRCFVAALFPTYNFMLKYELCAYFWPSAVTCREFSRTKAKRLVLFMLFSHVLCAALFSYVCTYRTISNTPNFTNCVRTSSDHLPSHYFPARKRKKKFWFHVR